MISVKEKLCMALVAVALLAAGIIWTEVELAEKQAQIWQESYPMANQGIEWTGAGYDLAYLRGGNN